jgi:hypothetical protein
MTMNVGLKNGETSGDSDKNVKLAKITFQELEIQTVKPYISVGYFSLGSEGGDSGMGGFPIRVNEISGSTMNDELVIGVDITLGLIKEDDGGFAADGKFNIIS